MLKPFLTTLLLIACVACFCFCFASNVWAVTFFGHYGTPAKVFYAVCALIAARVQWKEIAELERERRMRPTTNPYMEREH